MSYGDIMKKGLVFSGGGARGSYEVGVWKALEELNIHCDVAVGTSIGSVNAALYTQGSLEMALELWGEININTVFKENKLSVRMDPINLRKILENALNYNAIMKSDIKYGLVTCEFPKLKTIEITKENLTKENLIDYIIASCTVFPVFKLASVGEKSYVDGGFTTPIPLRLAKKLGATEFIIVNISMKKPNYKPNKKYKCTYIKHIGRLKSPLKFDKDTARRNLIYGYNDTMKAYKKLYGKRYTFKENYPDIKILEFIGRIFNIDDTIIYTQDEFNKIILDNNYKISIYGKERTISYKAYLYIERLRKGLK